MLWSKLNLRMQWLILFKASFCTIIFFKLSVYTKNNNSHSETILYTLFEHDMRSPLFFKFTSSEFQVQT